MASKLSDEPAELHKAKGDETVEMESTASVTSEWQEFDK